MQSIKFKFFLVLVNDGPLLLVVILEFSQFLFIYQILKSDGTQTLFKEKVQIPTLIIHHLFIPFFPFL
jgi:hypothetical protein